MKVSVEGNRIRLDFKYDEKIVAAVKQLPGARLCEGIFSLYWTIPYHAISQAMISGLFTEGHFYPDALSVIKNDRFAALEKVEIKPVPCRVRCFGPHDDLAELQRCLMDLCSYDSPESETEGIDEDYSITEESPLAGTLAQTLYFKDNGLSMQFPNGLFNRVKGFLDCYRLKNYIVYPGPDAPPKQLDLSIRDVIPRSYQDKSLQRIIDGTIGNRAILVMATGAGKTLLSAMITAELNVPTLFLTYSTVLLDQTISDYEGFLNIEIGRVGGRKKFSLKPVTVASIQTIYRCWEAQDERWAKLAAYLETVQLLFVDEGHMLGAETIYQVANLVNPYYSYALTATPYREDGKEIMIEGATGPAIELISDQDLEEGGWVLPVEVEMHQVKHYANLKRRRGWYKRLYDTEVVEHWERNRKIINSVRSHNGQQVLVLVQDIFHGNKISDVLKVPFIHGRTKAAERQEILRKFRSREIDILVASTILKQGVDIPSAEVLVLAHGGTSQVDLLQKIGRVRRPAPGKQKAIVVDFWDENVTPSDYKDVLKSQSMRRVALYRSRRFAITKMD